MLLAARKLGIGREEFWNLTDADLWIEAEAARSIRQREQDRDLALAWMVAALSRQKSLKSLKSLLARPAGPLTDEQRRQRQAEHDELVRSMNADGNG